MWETNPTRPVSNFVPIPINSIIKTMHKPNTLISYYYELISHDKRPRKKF